MTSVSPMLRPDLAELSLVCQDRIEETHDTTTFVFSCENEAKVEYKPGQFISLAVDIDSKQHYRAYTLSSTPSRPERLAVTIKRVDNGLVSNYLIDSLTPGASLPALAPAGIFYLDSDSFDKQDPQTKFVFISAGCGITPVMSMCRYLLDNQSSVSIHFIHCARTLDDVIFADELQRLSTQLPNFKLDLVFSKEQLNEHTYGRLDHQALQRLVPDVTGCSVYACGPDPFLEMIDKSLQERAFDMEHYHYESFVHGTVNELNNSDAGVAGNYSVNVPAFSKAIEVPAGSSLLDALEKESLPIIGACRSGVCGSCKCKVINADVDTSQQMALTEDEKQAGYVLACSTVIESDLDIELG